MGRMLSLFYGTVCALDLLFWLLAVQDQGGHAAQESADRVYDPADLPEAKHQPCDQEDDSGKKHDASAPDGDRAVLGFGLRGVLSVIGRNVEFCLMHPGIGKDGYGGGHEEHEDAVVEIICHVVRQRKRVSVHPNKHPDQDQSDAGRDLCREMAVKGIFLFLGIEVLDDRMLLAVVGILHPLYDQDQDGDRGNYHEYGIQDFFVHPSKTCYQFIEGGGEDDEGDAEGDPFAEMLHMLPVLQVVFYL